SLPGTGGGNGGAGNKVPLLPTSNGDITISGSGQYLFVGFNIGFSPIPFGTPAIILGRNVQISASQQNPISIIALALSGQLASGVYGTQSITIDMLDDRGGINSYNTPLFQYTNHGSTAAPQIGLPWLQGINGAPARLSIDSPNSALVLAITKGPIILGDITTPALAVTSADGSAITIDAGAKLTIPDITTPLTPPSLPLPPFFGIGGASSITQLDPANVVTINAPKISLSATNNISATVQSNTSSPLALNALATNVNLNAVGPVLLGGSSASQTFSLTTSPDNNGNASISIASGASVQ